MRRLAAIGIACAVAAGGAGCAEKDELRALERQVQQRELTPENVPSEIVLLDAEPVLVLEVEASESGYRLIPRRERGLPSQAILLDRGVLIEGFDAGGRRVAATSVPNPRLGRTEGPEGAEEFVLLEGSFEVALPQPEEIVRVTLTVQSGPSEGLQESLSIDSPSVK